MSAASKKMISCLQRINTLCDKYEEVTKPTILDRLYIINTVTKPRDRYKNTFKIRHIIKTINDNQWPAIERLFRLPERYRTLFTQAVADGYLYVAPF